MAADKWIYLVNMAADTLKTEQKSWVTNLASELKIIKIHLKFIKRNSLKMFYEKSFKKNSFQNKI